MIKKEKSKAKAKSKEKKQKNKKIQRFHSVKILYINGF